VTAPFRHRFEPAPLVLGLPLLFVGVGCVLRAVGEWRVSLWPLLLVVPAALCLAGLTALATGLVRRRLARRGVARAAEAQGADHATAD
jgi:hypothetical protein